METNKDWAAIMDDVEKCIEDFVHTHKGTGLRYYTIGRYDDNILVRISPNEDAPTPDFDTPLVRHLEKELQEKDESLEFWINQAHKIGITKRNKNGEAE